MVLVPRGHVLPGIHPTHTSFPYPLVRENHGSLSQCVSFSLNDVGSGVAAEQTQALAFRHSTYLVSIPGAWQT
eukprot:1162093-Pelagomonas_calceolata.AAC.11